MEKTTHYTTNEYEKNVQLTDEGMSEAERVLGGCSLLVFVSWSCWRPWSALVPRSGLPMVST